MLIFSSIRKVRDLLLGRADFSNLDQRLLNLICFLGGIVGFISAGVNYGIEGGMILTVSSVFQGFALLVGYAMSRFTGAYRTVVWPVLLLLLVFLAFQWFLNGGSTGGVQYFYLICVIAGAILLHGLQRYVIILLFVLLTNGVILTEYLHPEWVVPYLSREYRFADIAFSFTLCIILCGFLIAVLSGHYQQLVRRVRRYRTEFYEDLTLARTIQQEVFQHEAEDVEGFDVSVTYAPSSELGGDLYEITRSPEKLRILLADLKGHGINAALSAMLVKSEWTHSGHMSLEPGEALTELNRQIMARYPRALVLSAFVADLAGDRFSYASAGHLDQYWKDGDKLIELHASGVPIGLVPEALYHTETLPWQATSRLVLFTDAMTEEMDSQGNPTGSIWIEEIVKKQPGSSYLIAQTLIQKLKSRTGREPGKTTDDLTLIVIAPAPNR